MEKKIKISTVRSRISPKERQEAEKQRKKMDSSPLLLILYLIGIIGLMYAFVESEILSFPMFLVTASFTAVMTTVLWFFYFYRQKQFFLVVAIYSVIALLLGAWQIPAMVKVYNGILSSMFFGAGSSGNVGIGILALFILGLVFILFSLEFVLRRHTILFFLSAALVVAGPLFEFKIGPVSIVAIVAFQFGFYIVNMTDPKLKKVFVNKNRAKAAAVSTVAAAVLFVLAFIPAYVLQTIFEEPLFLGVYQADAVIKDVMDLITGDYGSDGINGNVSRGNLRQTGEPALNVELNDLPAERLYLRGFTGAYFTGDYWADDFDFASIDYDKPDAFYGDGRDYSDDSDDDYYDSDDTSYYPYNYGNVDYNPHCEYESQSAQRLMVERYRSLISELILRYFDNIKSTDLFTVSYSDNVISIYGIDEDGFMQFHLTVRGPDIAYGIVSSVGIAEDYDYSELSVTVSAEDSTCFISQADESDYYGKEFVPRITLKDEPDDGGYYSRTGGTIENYLSSSYPVYPEGVTFTYKMKDHPEMLDIINYPAFAMTTATSDVTGDVIYGINSSIAHNTAMKVTPLTNTANLYVPYLCKYNQAELYSRISKNQTNGENSYTNEFLSQSSLKTSGWWSILPNYDYLSESYQKSIDTSLTYYPAEDLPRLLELCNSQSLGQDVNEVTTFILYTLQNKARYSLTPGTVPWMRNTLEYFLFDNHKGFCVHYASTAVNMYRMFGIPARYVAGYVIDPTEFKTTDNSIFSYETTVTDYCAHAWVEIYLKDYGWVVVEVTPDTDNQMHASYPGYDEEEMNRIMKKHGWTFSQSADVETDGAGGAAIGGNIGSIFAFAAVFSPIAAVIILIIVFLLRRSIIKRRSSRESCRRSFDRMIRALHYAGRLKDKNGSESGFDVLLSENVSCINASLAAEIIEIMQQDNFSPERVGEEQTAVVRSAGSALRAELYRTLPWYKKLVYKYIKALI